MIFSYYFPDYFMFYTKCDFYSPIHVNLFFQDKELSFSEGDLLYVSDSSNDEKWWPARCRNQTGLIPANYGRF